MSENLGQRFIEPQVCAEFSDKLQKKLAPLSGSSAFELVSVQMLNERKVCKQIVPKASLLMWCFTAEHMANVKASVFGNGPEFWF